MDPDDVIRDFERLALDDATELEVDDAIAGLAVLLADPAITGKVCISSFRDAESAGI